VTTNEWVAVFVGIVTAITTVVGGAIRSSRATQLRKAISDDLAIVKALRAEHGTGALPALERGIERQSAELAAIVLHPMRASVFISAFVGFLMWGVVLIVYVTEGSRPLMFAEGVGRGVVNWTYVVAGLVAFALSLRGVRRTAIARSRMRSRILHGEPDGTQTAAIG
jgi:hypothetical protein